jgi:1-deoxy-D-xylulose-5-phosphate reductoisomerase
MRHGKAISPDLIIDDPDSILVFLRGFVGLFQSTVKDESLGPIRVQLLEQPDGAIELAGAEKRFGKLESSDGRAVCLLSENRGGAKTQCAHESRYDSNGAEGSSGFEVSARGGHEFNIETDDRKFQSILAAYSAPLIARMMPGSQTSPKSARPRGISILGSTGSIGRQTLDIVRLFPERFSVRALAARNSADALIEQALEFRPECVVITRESRYPQVRDALAGTGIEVHSGSDQLAHAATLDSVDVVMAAIVGSAGLGSVLEAVRVGKTIALANKETLVVAGEIVRFHARRSNALIVPVDSEHSAIFQCLVGESVEDVDELILTASGGPFLDRPASTLPDATPKEALAHPNWSMGPKISIDSATMMNKGLEVIEAHWLFGIGGDRIRVLVHPQSIIHSMVEFVDGSTKAQIGVPDMKVPIQYALTYPERWPAPHDRIDWNALSRLDFRQPAMDKFPCLGLAYDALATGGSAPAVLNAANEAAVDQFLKGKIRFTDISIAIADALEQLASSETPDLEKLIEIDAAARALVVELNRPTIH